MTAGHPLQRLLQPLWLRIALPIAASVALFSASIFLVHLPEVYDSLLNEKKAGLRNMAQMAWGMLEFHQARERRGELSRELAQELALGEIAGIRYGPDGKDYFWINDFHPRMLLHPYAPGLNGKDVSDYRDPTGKRLFTEMVQASAATGSAFVAYHWQWKDDSALVVPKVSFVKRFEPWGWIVGTGVYLDDIRKEAEAQARSLLLTSLGVLGLAALLSLLSIWQGVKAARTIRDSEATLRGIFDQTTEFLGVLDLDGDVRSVNRTALDFAGVSREEVRDRPFWETAWWRGEPAARHALRSAVTRARDGERSRFETRCVAPDGREITLDVSIQPLRDEEGAPVSILADGVDITERKRTQQELEARVAERTRELEHSLDSLRQAQNQLVQAEKMAALGGLVAGVAHEINTPLGLGMTNASYLQEQLDAIRESYAAGRFTKGEFETFLEHAGEAVRSMLINLRRGAEIIRSFKQVAVDQEVEERRAFDLREYLEEVLVSLKPRYKRTGHTVSVDCPEGVRLDTYPGALMQVLSNLIINSLTHGFEHAARGEIRIRVAPQGDRVVLDYADNGRGMSPEEQAKVYDPFFTTKQGAGGTGLGMHIVFNLVTQKLGGDIALETAPGQGVRFILTLPRTLPRPGAA